MLFLRQSENQDALFICKDSLTWSVGFITIIVRSWFKGGY